MLSYIKIFNILQMWNHKSVRKGGYYLNNGAEITG